MKFLIKEFKEQYPHYNMGFTASNPLTETEKVIGLKMASLVYDPITKKEYQEFPLYDKYNALKDAIKDRRVHSFEMSVNNNTFNIFVKLDSNDSILGVCAETHERIAFCEERYYLMIPKVDESHSSDWFDYLD